MFERKQLDEDVTDAALDVTAGTAATLAGIGLGASPVLATIVGASGPALKLAQRVSARAMSRREDRAAQAVEQAAAILDVGLDIFEERASSYDGRLELLARVLEAAARTPLDEKITALARVLASGLEEGSDVGEAIVLVAALTDLEAPHIAVLEAMTRSAVPPESTWSGTTEPRGWEATQIARVLPPVAGVVDGVIAVLGGHGLIRNLNDGTWDGIASSSMYAVTPLGRRCLLLLGYEQPIAAEGGDVGDSAETA